MKFLYVVAALVFLSMGIWLGRCTVSHDHSDGSPQSTQAELWSCPMHPKFVLPEFGQCGICGMDLVMRTGDDPGPRRMSMSEDDRQLLAVETAEVKRRLVQKTIRMVGKVDFDETRIRTISARVPGRLDRLFVDYTGIRVRKGDHLVSLYSPEVVTAQAELLQARKRLDGSKGESPFLTESSKQAYDSARDKLLLWGLSEEQLQQIEERGTTEDHILINSPSQGIVIHKAVNEGDYVQTGTRIYQIAGMDQLWLRLDAYEQDLPWIRYGQEVSVQAEALPGEVVSGWISFISPTVDESTRTVKVRVNLPNPEEKLKPGMFVRALVRANVSKAGRVLDPRLEGKWISPMHPEIVKDAPGQCDICGMDLVPAAELGYVTSSGASEQPLTVPASAVLVTGKRAVVYVQAIDQERPTYEGREVVLGPRSESHYIVLAGLQEGERVVSKGAFLIDSALQIQAKPSMMSMPGEAGTYLGSEGAAFRAGTEPLFTAYLAIQVALAADDLSLAQSQYQAAVKVVQGLDPGDLPAAASELAALQAALVAETPQTIEDLRQTFDQLSRVLLRIEQTFGHAGSVLHFEMHCPMAFNNTGASWLQSDEQIANPYFGASMLRCGSVERQHAGVQK